MEWAYQLSWQRFLLSLIIISAIYLLLQVFHRLIHRAGFLRSFRISLGEWLRVALLVYEPFAFLLLIVLFAYVNLAIHGVLLLLLLFFSIGHMRDYINGQLIKFNASFGPGKQMKLQQDHGMITEVGKFGVKIKTNHGVQYLQYGRLIEQGYFLLSGENISGYYQLAIGTIPSNTKTTKINAQYILDLLSTSPYLDWTQQPEIFPTSTSEEIHVRFLVKEEDHLYDLISLIKEKGFSCEIIQL